MSTDVYGIDFSGSKAPGRKIWLTKGTVTDDPEHHLTIESVLPATDRFETTGRESILTALVDFVRDLNTAVIGLDFPFGLPSSTFDADDWCGFLETFADRFDGKDIDEYPGSLATNGRTRREIDYQFAGQSPMSPQLRYQVFYGLRDVLYPLVTENAVRVVPMQKYDSSKPTLLEVYPAATFGVERCYRTGYKDRTDESRQRRLYNARTLQDHDLMSIDDEIIETVAESDDALDSLCAAFAVRRGLSDGFEHEPEFPLEGYLYV